MVSLAMLRTGYEFLWVQKYDRTLMSDVLFPKWFKIYMIGILPRGFATVSFHIFRFFRFFRHLLVYSRQTTINLAAYTLSRIPTSVRQVTCFLNDTTYDSMRYEKVMPYRRYIQYPLVLYSNFS